MYQWIFVPSILEVTAKPGQSPPTTSETQDRGHNDDKWLLRFSPLAHVHENVTCQTRLHILHIKMKNSLKVWNRSTLPEPMFSICRTGQETNSSINNNDACGSFISKHPWRGGESPRDPMAGFLGGWDKHRPVEMLAFLARLLLLYWPGRIGALVTGETGLETFLFLMEPLGFLRYSEHGGDAWML